MSTFSLFNTAYSGLAAARAALEVTGQNVANVNTAGYTRQRVDQASVAGTDYSSRYTLGLNIGQGTTITGIARLNDALVDSRVRDTAASSGYWSAASSALSSVETSVDGLGSDGLSGALTTFWNAWGSMSNAPTSSSAASTLLSAAQTLTGRIAAGYTDARTGWANQRTATAGTVATVNQAASTVATLNDQILRITVSGGNANELMDKRDAALGTLSTLVGATTRTNANGSIDVIAGGSTLVTGGSARTLVLAGSVSLEGASTSPVQLEFAGQSGTAVQVAGGSLAAQLGSLAAATPAGTGGAFAEAAAAYNRMASTLEQQVNAAHTAGQTPSGATGKKFFDLTSTTGAAALALTVVPTSVAGIAASSGTPGSSDGTVADAISQLGAGSDSPDADWAAFVTGLGASAQAASTRSSVADSAATSAQNAHTSQSGVDLDEETANLVVYQHAYQGAARVLSAIDEMLDTLINRTGAGRG